MSPANPKVANPISPEQSSAQDPDETPPQSAASFNRESKPDAAAESAPTDSIDLFGIFDTGAFPAPTWYVPDEDGEYPDEKPIDFIETYADYADVLEAPREMHEAVAEQLVATVLNRNGVTIPHGTLRYSLDLWTLLLSDSGGGRSTLIGLPGPILEKAGLTGMERDAHWGSLQALYQQVADNPTALWTWGEISERLRLLNQSQFAGGKEWITDRYDNFKPPAPITYRQTGKNKDTPPIGFTQAPRISILATSSEAWFFTNLLQEDSTGGFLPRWVPIRAKGLGKDVPTPKATHAALAEELATRLRQIAKLKGEPDLSEILDDYDRWYRETKRRFEAQPNRALAMAYFNRHRVHVLKFAVIYEVSASGSLKVSRAAWERAVLKAKRLEETIFGLLSTGMNSAGYALSRMEDRIRDAGADGLSLSALTLAFRHEKAEERKARLSTLIQAESIFPFSRYTSGRSATILVHRDFFSDYRTRNPHDQQITQWKEK